jgi:hypothetical protein
MVRTRRAAKLTPASNDFHPTTGSLQPRETSSPMPPILPNNTGAEFASNITDYMAANRWELPAAWFQPLPSSIVFDASKPIVENAERPPSYVDVPFESGKRTVEPKRISSPSYAKAMSEKFYGTKEKVEEIPVPAVVVRSDSQLTAPPSPSPQVQDKEGEKKAKKGKRKREDNEESDARLLDHSWISYEDDSYTVPNYCACTSCKNIRPVHSFFDDRMVKWSDKKQLADRGIMTFDGTVSIQDIKKNCKGCREKGVIHYKKKAKKEKKEKKIDENAKEPVEALLSLSSDTQPRPRPLSLPSSPVLCRKCYEEIDLHGKDSWLPPPGNHTSWTPQTPPHHDIIEHRRKSFDYKLDNTRLEHANYLDY